MSETGGKSGDSGRTVRAAVDLDERKERVLHTRVPDSLDRHIKQRARSLGMSVSTVVRHVLLNTFGLVEDIVTDSAKIALSIAGGDEDASDAGIVGWQEAVLHRNAVCDHCNAILAKGSRAAIAVRERTGPRAIICRRCLEALAEPSRAGRQRKKRRSARS